MNSHEAHAHHCNTCDITWYHTTGRHSVTDEEYEQMHQCPRCGVSVTAHYNGVYVKAETIIEEPVVHTSINQAKHAIFTALNFPLYTEMDYELFHAFLNETQETLRRVYLGGQLGDTPRSWRIDGALFRIWDQRLNEARERLVLRYRASKFFMGQRRADQKRELAKKNLTSWLTLDSAEQALLFKKRGFNVRELRIGRTTLYQYASLKETPKGKTQL